MIKKTKHIEIIENKNRNFTNIATPHIKVGDIPFTKTVLMPGDPKRAEVIANRYLDNVAVISDIRGIKAYRGTYKMDILGVQVSEDITIMASGMGMPSIGIYAHELYNLFGVENIIRIGSIGGLSDDLKLGDLVIAQSASTNSNYYAQYKLVGYNYAATPDFNITSLLHANAQLLTNGKSDVFVGNILSSDTFYAEDSPNWLKMGVLGIEMESAALFTEAAVAKKKAGSICTVSDLIFNKNKQLSAEERQNNLDLMILTALKTALDLQKEE